MSVCAQRLPRVLPLVWRELSLLILWLLATPIIYNYLAVKRIFYPIWFACIGCGHLVRWWLLYYRGQPFPRALRWLCHVPLLFLIPLWAIILGGEIRLIDAHPIALFCFGGLIGFLHLSRRLHGRLYGGLPVALIGLLLGLALHYQLFALSAAYLGLGVLLTLGGVLFRRSLYLVPAWVVAMALMNVYVIFALVHFRFVNGTHLDRLSVHPAVERLFLYDAADPVGRVVGKNIMTMQEACEPDTYLISSHHGQSGVFLVNQRTHTVQAHPDIAEGSNDLLVNCDAHEVVVGAFNHPSGLYTVDLRHWPSLAQPMVPVPGRGVVYILADPAHHQYVVFPNMQRLYAVDAHTGHITQTVLGPDERAYDPQRHELTVLTEPDFTLARFKLSHSPQAPLQLLRQRSLEIPVYKRLQMYLSPGPSEGTTLVTSVWDGTITLYDDAFQPLRQTYIAPGLSAMVLTPDRQHVLIGGYADGYLYCMNMTTWDVVARLYLGHRMRELRLSGDGRRVYVGTSQGGFRIDLARLLEPERRVQQR